VKLSDFWKKEAELEGKTVRGIYDHGELRFAEPVDVEGCWKVEITFVEQEDEDVPLSADPHLPERLLTPNRREEIHRQIEDQRPPSRPY
jgi:hypothetical protein